MTLANYLLNYGVSEEYFNKIVAQDREFFINYIQWGNTNEETNLSAKAIERLEQLFDADEKAAAKKAANKAPVVPDTAAGIPLKQVPFSQMEQQAVNSEPVKPQVVKETPKVNMMPRPAEESPINAAPVEKPIEKPAETPIEEPVEKPAEIPAETPVETKEEVKEEVKEPTVEEPQATEAPEEEKPEKRRRRKQPMETVEPKKRKKTKSTMTKTYMSEHGRVSDGDLKSFRMLLMNEGLKKAEEVALMSDVEVKDFFDKEFYIISSATETYMIRREALATILGDVCVFENGAAVNE